MLASFAGRRRDLSDASLLAMFFAYPLMTLKVMESTMGPCAYG